jgi:hypothetical protein
MGCRPFKPHSVIADLPLSVSALRIAYTLFLVSVGFGLVQAQLYLLLSIRTSQGQWFPSPQDIANHFYVKKIPLLKKAIDGNMSEYIDSNDDRQALYQWMKAMAPRNVYEKRIKEILEDSCVECHAPNEEAFFADFTKYEGIQKVAIFSYVPYLRARLRISHPHMLAIPLFMLPIVLGLLFTPLKTNWKIALMALPFLGVLLDISSWFLTMVFPWGAWFILLGGGMTAFSVVLAILLNLYFLWRP